MKMEDVLTADEIKVLNPKNNRKLILSLTERILALESKLSYTKTNVDTSEWKNCDSWELGGC